MVMEKLRKQTKLYLWIVVGAFIGWIFFQLGENIAMRRKLKPWQRGILAEVDGRVRYEDMVEGKTVRIERDDHGTSRKVIMEHKGDMHPQIPVSYTHLTLPTN